MSDLDDAVFADIFAGEGAVALSWEAATRCSCFTSDSRQPTWGCPACAGRGAVYGTPVTILALFRSQGRWLSFRREGELDHGEAQLTTPLSQKPGYTDRRVRDRYTTQQAVGDLAAGRRFYPAAPPSPFIFAGVQRAWRVQLQSATLVEELNP